MYESETDLYELIKRKYEAQMKLEALQYQQRLNSLREISGSLQEMKAKHRENVSQMNAAMEDFNKTKPQIEGKLECQNYLNIPRENGGSLKKVFEKGLGMFNVNLSGVAEVQEVSDDTMDPFFTTANKGLRVHDEFSKFSGDLASILKESKGSDSNDLEETKVVRKSEEEGANSEASDDTVITIASENVFASSPI